jgi:NADH dehydrogenase
VHAGIKRYVHMSALGTRPDAVSRYHQTKWDAEQIVRASPLAWTIFRPSLIHGPRGEFMQMMKFFSTSKVRQPVMPYFGRGTTMIQPVDVRDVATLFVKALRLPETIGQVYELGGPERFTWKDLYDVCATAIAGHKRAKVSVPVPLAKIIARTVMPLTPRLLVPYKFNVAQVQMSQEDSICNITPVERTFGIRLRDFRTELAQYADML